MVYSGKSCKNGWFGGTPILGNPHIISTSLDGILILWYTYVHGRDGICRTFNHCNAQHAAIFSPTRPEGFAPARGQAMGKKCFTVWKSINKPSKNDAFAKKHAGFWALHQEEWRMYWLRMTYHHLLPWGNCMTVFINLLPFWTLPAKGVVLCSHQRGLQRL